MADGAVKRIGDRLIRTRESLGLTLQQLSSISGVAPSTIQKVEAGTMVPSVAVMMKIARGLRKKIGFFLDDEEENIEVNLVRKQERQEAKCDSKSFSVTTLTGDLLNPEMDGFTLTLPPGAHSGDEPLHHRGDEIVYCIRGRITFTIEGKRYRLGPGDSLHFKSDLSHYWKNTGGSKAELLIVCSLPPHVEKSVIRGNK